jgi:hypothetical protein
MTVRDRNDVMNEEADSRLPDEVLCVPWMIECGSPSLQRGPARAEFHEDVRQSVGSIRRLYNAGTHGNGDGAIAE